MSSIEQLLHDAMTEQTEAVPHLRPGTARRSVARSRRTHRTRVVAASAATVAATAGVSAVAIGLQPGVASPVSAGSPGAGSAPAAVPTTAAAAPTAGVVPSSAPAPATKTVPVTGSPAAAPVSGDDGGVGMSESQAPAELRAVTLAGPVADLALRGGPSYQLSTSGTWSKWFWFGPAGSPDSSGSVIVTRGVERPSWNQAQSPSPAVSPVSVHGDTGAVWLSGGDREIYYAAGDLTVEVFVSDNGVSLAQIDKIADAVQGLPQ